jgi:uncharacterized membrane protein YeiB
LSPKAQAVPRILGYDLARALAMLSMIADHAAQVIGPQKPTGWGQRLLEALDGRATALFVVLAGVGISLIGRKTDPARQRKTLLRRGAFLLLLGFLNQAIWPGDVLRVFGVALIAAAFLAHLSAPRLLAVAAGCVLAFPALMLAFNYNAHWDWSRMVYRGLWSPSGILRNLFFDGFRPVFPWAGLLFFGMWLGRLDANDPRVRRNMLVTGVALTAAVELACHALLAYWLKHPAGFSDETIRNLADPGSLPPLPPFVLSVAGTALAATGVCLILAARYPKSPATTALVSTGQLALTWYVAHILLGALFVKAVGWHRAPSVATGLVAGVSLFALIALASALYKHRFKYGPLEWCLRAVG